MINHVNTAAPQVPQVNVNVGGAAAPASAAVGTVARSVGQQLGTVNVNVSAAGSQSSAGHQPGAGRRQGGSSDGGQLHYQDPIWNKLMGGDDSGSCASRSSDSGHGSCGHDGIDFDDPDTYKPQDLSKCELDKMKVVDPDGEGKCNPDTADRYDPETGAIYKSVTDDGGNTRWMVSGKAEPGQWCYDGSKEDLKGIVYFDDETHRPEGEGSVSGHGGCGSGRGSHGDYSGGDYSDSDARGCNADAAPEQASSWGAGETGNANGPHRSRSHAGARGSHFGGDVNITINLGSAADGDAASASTPAPVAAPAGTTSV